MSKGFNLPQKSILLPSLLLAIILTALLGVLVPFDFSGKKVTLVTSEFVGFKKEIRFADLNADGTSERIEFNFDERIAPFLMIIGDDRVQDQIDFPGIWFPSDGLFIGDADQDSLAEIYTFICRGDSLFCAFTEPWANQPVLRELFILRLDPDFRNTDIHVETLGLVQAATGRELIINLGARWFPEGSALIRINPETLSVVVTRPPLPLMDARLVRDPAGKRDIIAGNVYSDPAGRLKLAVYSVQFEPLFTPVDLDPGSENARITPVTSDKGLNLAVLTDNPDVSGGAVLSVFDCGGRRISRVVIPEPEDAVDPLPYARNMNYRYATVNREEEISTFGFSARCVRNDLNDSTVGFVDPRDGRFYPTFKTGKYTWMAENLDYAGAVPNWPVPLDSPSPGRYGRLYTWESAGKACPPGWHLSTDAEWQQMEVRAGMSRFAYDLGWRWYNGAGRRIQSEKGWYSDSLSNLTGFSALPAGHWWEEKNTIRNKGRHSYFWTSTRSGQWMVYDPDPVKPGFYLIHSSGEVRLYDEAGFLKDKDMAVPDFKVAGYQLKDLDGNGTPEFVYLSARGNNLVALDTRLRNPVMLPIVYIYGEACMTPAYEKGRIKQWYLQNGDRGWYFTYQQHKWLWHAGFALLLLIFLSAVFCLIFGWQRQIIRKRALLEKKMLDLQYQGIASQFNPHLTFNLFNTVSGFLYANQQDEALRLTTRYAQLLRRTMFNGRSFEITLEEELLAVTDLLEIEVICTEGRFRYDISTDPGHAEVRLPRSLIFMFAENAIKHGARAQNNGACMRIVTRMEPGALIVEVIDNGPGLHPSINGSNGTNGTGSGFRIANEVIELYRAHSGRRIRYEFLPAPDASPDTFTVVKITIPNSPGK